MSARSTRNIRSDARDNRERLARVARETFAARGLEVAMREIARRAGLGIATVYRHYPTREDLITAAFTEQVTACSATMAAAVEDPDPWRGLTTVVHEICGRQALDRGFNATLLGSESTRTLFAAGRAANARSLELLVARARQAKVVRADLTVGDVGIVLRAASAVSASSRDPLTDVRRLAALLLRGIRAEPAEPLCE
ncbi:TetR/AcrR family transcriptional regulator [Streptomyces malaysiensis]|uniref:TetR/AcrR family transcriptional regulator n=1 Tax=Streptomyces malaysiensis TaxID=92644 RepID=UPI0036A9C27E